MYLSDVTRLSFIILRTRNLNYSYIFINIKSLFLETIFDLIADPENTFAAKTCRLRNSSQCPKYMHICTYVDALYVHNYSEKSVLSNILRLNLSISYI
jgi:hypothetical protein